jgi:protein-disulfide isomerase
LTLTSAGLLVSILSALESRVQWIASFCAMFGEGCQRTEDFSLFKIPVSWWGIGYYVALAFLIYFAKPWILWFVIAGFGFELTFLWIMISIRAFCIFCLFNAVVVAGLVWYVFDPAQIWKSVSLILFFFMCSNYLISRENLSTISKGAEKQPESAVASINGDNITEKDLERPLAQRIYELETKIYKLKRDRLKRMIHDVLLEKEANYRKISRKKLLETITTEIPNVSEEEIERYRRNNRPQLEMEELDKEHVKKILAQKKKRQQIWRFADSLKEKYHVEIFLQKPSLPLTKVVVEGRPTLGPSDGRVVVVEFSDPFCPACRKAHETTKKVKNAYGDQIRWVFKDFPLKTHKGAKKVLEAAHCAEEQGKFWEYQDIVFNAEEKPDADTLKKYAESLDLDREQFDRCLDNRTYRTQIENDIRDGQKAGISSTPTFIINGKMLSGALSFDKFTRKIDEELKKTTTVRSKKSVFP